MRFGGVEVRLRGVAPIAEYLGAFGGDLKGGGGVGVLALFRAALAAASAAALAAFASSRARFC